MPVCLWNHTMIYACKYDSLSGQIFEYSFEGSAPSSKMILTWSSRPNQQHAGGGKAKKGKQELSIHMGGK